MNILDVELPGSEDISSDLEEQVMGLIINSGHARSCAYEALALAKQGNFVKAEEVMQAARAALNEAHLVQTKLIEQDQGKARPR